MNEVVTKLSVNSDQWIGGIGLIKQYHEIPFTSLPGPSYKAS